jgi:hypothetical protein
MSSEEMPELAHADECIDEIVPKVFDLTRKVTEQRLLVLLGSTRDSPLLEKWM